MCWYCYWGMPKRVAEIYQRASKALDGYTDPLHFGPGHIVWDDQNFDSAEWCLEHFNEYLGNYSDDEYAIVRRSLEELAAIPMEERCPEPEWDGENPELSPPAPDVVMLQEVKCGEWRQTWPR